MPKFTYDYNGLSFITYIQDYWSEIYHGQPRNTLYHDYQVMLSIVKKVSKEKWIVDVGVNNGLFAFPASLLGYKVIGFEPVRSTFQNIQKAVIENNLAEVGMFNMALSNETGEKNIYVPECPDNASFSADAAVANMKKKDYEVEEVKTIRFDDWIKEFPQYKNVGLIKIDAQGSEYNILEGMKEFLINAHDLYIIAEFELHLIAMGYTYKQLDDLIISYGFEDMGKLCGNDKLFYKK